jgi:hypothetical protein
LSNNKKYDFIFLGLGQNIEKTIHSFFEFLEKLHHQSHYKKICMIIGENGSLDNTKELLRTYKNDFFELIVVDTSLISKIKNRILRITQGREMLKNFVARNKMFSTFVSVVDLDDVINLEIDIKNFCMAVKTLEENKDTLFAISSKSKPYYYDMLNLIIPNYYETDILSELQKKIFNFYGVRKKNVYEPQMKITSMRDVDTISSHNGLCVYLYDDYVASSYISNYNDREESKYITPEHIVFNKLIHSKSKKFVRMTNLINLKTPYEHLPFRTFKSFFWIKLKLLIKKKLGSI